MVARSLILIGALAIAGTSHGASPAARPEQFVSIWGSQSRVRLVTKPGHSTPTGEETTAARVCAYTRAPRAAATCFSAKTPRETFFAAPRATVVPFVGSGNAVLFTADYNAGGSGTGHLWALLVFGSGGHWKNLFPLLTSSEQSDVLYWHLPRASRYGLFTVAEYTWEKGETHFSRHRYEIKTYEFCASRDTYVLADAFLTRAKFPGLDETDTISVIKPSLAQIQKRLLRGHLPACN